MHAQSLPLRGLLTIALAVWLGQAAPVRAQDDAQDPAVDVQWPGIGELAVAVTDPALRLDAMITVAAAARMQAGVRAHSPLHPEDAVRQMLADRDWLAGLARRYGETIPRSPILDPAAWRVQLQLDQYGLLPSYISSPLGPGLEVTLEQAFDRDDASLAAAALPELLWYLEANASLSWAAFNDMVGGNPAMAEALASAATPLVSGWSQASGATGTAPEASATGDGEAILQAAEVELADYVRQLVEIGPPDSQSLRQMEARLLQAMPQLADHQRVRAGSLLHMARLVDGLIERRYFHFTEGLLAIMAQLEQYAGVYPEDVRRFATWMNDALPVLSRTYAREFAAVDPRLNSAIAAAYDVAGFLARSQPAADVRSAREGIADAVARLALLVPDMGYYFDLPVRDTVAGAVDACTGIVAVRDPDGSPGLTRELFDDCQQTLVDLADREAREPQLAGDPAGPFGEAQLRRELGLTAGQRINYGIGYLHQRYQTGCELPSRPLPNPLEWAYLATFMSWLAEQSPVFFQTPENEARLNRMQAIGIELNLALAEQVDCVTGAGTRLDDPVSRVTDDYREELTALGRSLQSAELEFRERFLAPGADVNLAGDARQSTAYRPDDLVIGPCSTENICEMSGVLSSTRALAGLFPDTWLLADQVGLGELEICYDDVGWEDRRSQPVREGDTNVANYYGRLGFTLRGRFVGQEATHDLFGFRFISPGEHHYLFSAASEEVLNDACPVEWVGSRIVTELPSGKRGLVPNRLTYLSAPRTLPSRLLAANWERGEEWRDWFVTGLGVETVSIESPPDPSPALSQRLQQLRQREQAAIYGSLLERPADGDTLLSTPVRDQLARLETAKELVRMQMMLFYPHVLGQDDILRASLAGEHGLLDIEGLDRFRKENRALDQVIDTGIRRLDAFEQQWATLPEAVRRSGSIADSVSHATTRLNAVADQFFSPAPIAPPSPPQLERLPEPASGTGPVETPAPTGALPASDGPGAEAQDPGAPVPEAPDGVEAG